MFMLFKIVKRKEQLIIKTTVRNIIVWKTIVRNMIVRIVTVQKIVRQNLDLSKLFLQCWTRTKNKYRAVKVWTGVIREDDCASNKYNSLI
jgi:methyl coenzyme M reductase subunit C